MEEGGSGRGSADASRNPQQPGPNESLHDQILTPFLQVDHLDLHDDLGRVHPRHIEPLHENRMGSRQASWRRRSSYGARDLNRLPVGIAAGGLEATGLEARSMPKSVVRCVPSFTMAARFWDFERASALLARGKDPLGVTDAKLGNSRHCPRTSAHGSPHIFRMSGISGGRTS